MYSSLIARQWPLQSASHRNLPIQEPEIEHLILTGAETEHSVKEESSLKLIWTHRLIRQYITNAVKLRITISKANGKKSGLWLLVTLQG